MLNGRPVGPASLVEGPLALDGLAADNLLEVDATMAYRHDGQGLHRSLDPADDEHYVYGHLFLDAARCSRASTSRTSAPNTVRRRRRRRGRLRSGNGGGHHGRPRAQ